MIQLCNFFCVQFDPRLKPWAYLDGFVNNKKNGRHNDVRFFA